MKRFWLECGEATIALEPRDVVIGRSRKCDLVVNDTAVSRRHARLSVSAANLTVEDLGSSNGVIVNGKRVSGELLELHDGDNLQIGPALLVVRSEEIRMNYASSLTPQTMPGRCELPYLAAPAEPPASENEATAQRHAIVSLGAVADKLLAMGRADDAERMLTNTLHDILAKARSGRAARLPAETCPMAALYAVALADATGRGKWVDYIANLYGALNRPLPGDIVDRLYETGRKVSGIDLNGFREYVEQMRALRDLSAAERFVIQRLQGLAGLILPNVRA